MTVEEFIKNFYRGTLGKKRVEGSWRVQAVDDQVDYYMTRQHGGIEKLVFNSKKTQFVGGYTVNGYDKYEPIIDTVAYRFPDGLVIYNASVLDGAVRKAWGYSMRNAMRADCQIWLDALGAKPIPFNIFTEMGLRLDEAMLRFKWIIRPVAEKVWRKESTERVWIPENPTPENNFSRGHYEEKPKLTEEHFAGAAIFSIDDAYYLFDYDRKEQEKNQIFNPFVVQLPGPAKNFIEAYELLKPSIVKDALNNKVPVDRQGEFFFIYVGDVRPVTPKLTEEQVQIIRYPPSYSGFFMENSRNHRCDDQRALMCNAETADERKYAEDLKKYREIRDYVDDLVSGELNIGGMSRHIAKYGFRDRKTGKTYVTGLVQHQHREHGDLNLDGWWLVVPNTAVKSVTIEGRID